MSGCLNLRVGSAPCLANFVDWAVGRHGHEPVFKLVDVSIIQVEGWFFYQRRTPREVGGPFNSLADFLRSEGRRVGGTLDAEAPEIWHCFARDWAVSDVDARLVGPQSGRASIRSNTPGQ